MKVFFYFQSMDKHNRYLVRQNHLWGLGFDWDEEKENRNVKIILKWIKFKV